MHKAVKSAGVEASTLITSVSADTGSLSIRKICCARSKLSKSSSGRSEEEDHKIITFGVHDLPGREGPDISAAVV